ncbi:MAG: ACT domain-containing protein [Clostridia bacterium]|nr:ACT domain-containing protein [Clostridia bacterium]MCI1958531.1 ACT domain-containing protein [Clostridia bacterium]MCI2000803.1 ACT domain-containing protein [Clostridia bacterium]MCI2015405.1 ACT domain-containing protein [Clostridia bacterium]
MKEDKKFYIVDKSVLPEIFLKVMEVKNLLESGREKTVQDAVANVGISRSAFYKYRDAIFPLYENSRGKTVTFGATLDDTKGVLSCVLNQIATAGANILTINQNIPINGIANVTVTIETNAMCSDIGSLLNELESIQGVLSVKIIARE